MQYTSQPFVYRESPNPAFHEAVAHAIGLCAGGPVHLQRMGLLSSPISTSSGNSMINIEYLLNIALDKLPFMAFSITLEKVCEEKETNVFAYNLHSKTLIYIFIVEMVCIRERTYWNERTMVGFEITISRSCPTNLSHKFSFRCWCKISCHFGSGLYKIFRCNNFAISNIR